MSAGQQPTSLPGTRSGARFPYSSHTAPRHPTKSKQERLDNKAQLYLEKIYADINSLWRQACEFPGTFKLRDFSELLIWPDLNPPNRYIEAQDVLGEALLCISLRSRSFLNLLIGAKPPDVEFWKVLLRLIKDNETSLGQFVFTRNLNWFNSFPFKSVTVPANWPRFLIQHPHEVYRAEDGSIKRCVFRNDNGSYYEMTNITENLYDKANWGRSLPKPKYWPEWQPFPGDPSICPPDGYEPYAFCHGGCGQWTGISNTTCKCVAEETYIHALVEIVQMVSWKSGEINRGVRAVA